MIDIAGGLLVTGPSGHDWRSDEIRPYLEKYLAGAVPAAERLALLNLASDLLAREYAGYQSVLAVHAEGSLEAEKLMICRSYDPGRRSPSRASSPVSDPADGGDGASRRLPTEACPRRGRGGGRRDGERRIRGRARPRSTVTPGWHRMWSNPSIDRDRDVAVIESESGELCGYLYVHAEPPHTEVFALGIVALASRGLGLGSALVAENERRARRFLELAEPGTRVVIHAGALADEPRSARLLTARGYREVRRFSLMRTDFEEGSRPVAAPAGIEVRTVMRADAVPMHEVHLEAFGDHWGAGETPLAEFLHYSFEAVDFDPGLWLVAVAGEQVVGYLGATEEAAEDPSRGYVKLLGVRRAFRRRGIGEALLLHAFQNLAARGKAGCDLHVDSESLTGATRLYERVGMTPHPRFATWEKELRPGRG